MRTFSNINEYLYATNFSHSANRPRIICADGFELSVQAGHFYYSIPKKDNQTLYQACEIGMPSAKEELILPYIECDEDDPTETIYPYTPVSVIDRVIEKHGGYFSVL